MDKYKKLATNTLIFAIGTFSSKALAFLLMPFVTRMLTTSDYGDADLIQQTVNVLIPIVFLQINSAALRFALDKDSDKGEVFSVGLRTTFIGFAVFLLLWYPISLIKIKDFALGDYMVQIYIFVLVSGIRQLCQQFVRGSGHVKTYAIDGIFATVTTLVFNLLFLGVFKWGVNGYIFAIIASDACSVAFLFITCKLCRQIKVRGVRASSWSDMLRYSVPMMPTIILWWIINVSDRYMITGFIGSAENGLYTADSQIRNFVIIFSTI
ncbi:MAG: oligosaccharide flippase family protein, partial [Eubacterium sp.]|nr:oligosaccharide flippase family protein [Eubacterium sp.]